MLCEKPFTSNAEEARELTKLAKQKELVLEEAVRRFLLPPSGLRSGANCCEKFHWQFHPAAHAWRQLLDSKKYGNILRTNAVMTASPAVPGSDIRWKFDLGGIHPLIPIS